jgi:hypothetical protein
MKFEALTAHATATAHQLPDLLLGLLVLLPLGRCGAPD